MRHFYILLTALSLLFAACNQSSNEKDKKSIFVTINPLRTIAEELTCGDFEVEVLVPRGASPETFEPTMQQIASLNKAEFLFEVGLIDFEQSLINRLDDDVEVVNLSDGIAILAGCCSHGNKHHTHGIDPHIWTAPRSLATMVSNIHSAIKLHYPDSVKYDIAAEKILNRLALLDQRCKSRIDEAGVNAIMIYHPAYTYLAHDYGIEQIAIEHDGKEPTPKQLTTLIDKAKAKGIGVIFHQPQYNANKLTAIANETGADIIVTDPLADDIVAEIDHVINLICDGKR